MGSRMGVSRREHSTTDEALNQVLQGENLLSWKWALFPVGILRLCFGGLYSRDQALASRGVHDVIGCITCARRASKRCSHCSAARCVRWNALWEMEPHLFKGTKKWYKNVLYRAGLSHSICHVRVRSAGFLAAAPRVSALGSGPYRGPYSALACCSDASSEKLLCYPENVSRASYLQQMRIKGIHSLRFPLSFYSLLWVVTPSLSKDCWCRLLFSVRCTAPYRPTCSQGLLEPPTQQCFTCDKTKGGFMVFCTGENTILF